MAKNKKDSFQQQVQSGEKKLTGAEDSNLSASIQKNVQPFAIHKSIAQERLPMLDVIFDRFIRGLATHLRNLTSDNVEITLEQIHSLRFNDYLDAVPSQVLIGVFRAEEWDNSGLLLVDAPLISSIVDVLLGGRKPEIRSYTEGRAYTTIERNLVERLFHVALQELENAFTPLTPVNFSLDRLENNPKFTGIVRPASPCVVVRLKIHMEGRGGALQFLFPHATLEPVHHLLVEMFLGEKFGRDAAWENHVTEELLTTDLTLDAVLDERTFGLGDVMLWKKGTSIYLGAGKDCHVTLKCENHPIFSGKMGQKRGQLALSIEKDFLKNFQEES